jgi:hypothetical protein
MANLSVQCALQANRVFWGATWYWSRDVYNSTKFIATVHARLTLNLKERTLSQAWSLLSMLLTLTVAAAFGHSSPISRKVIFIGVRADCQVVNRCLERNGCKLHLLADSSPNAALCLAAIGILRTCQLCRAWAIQQFLPSSLAPLTTQISKLPAPRDALGPWYNVCGLRPELSFGSFISQALPHAFPTLSPKLFRVISP